MKYPPSKNFPEGVKARFVLVDVQIRKAVFLVDNHAPYGFHAHTDLPDNKEVREKLNTMSYQKALDYFFDAIEGIVHEKK